MHYAVFAVAAVLAGCSSSTAAPRDATAPGAPFAPAGVAPLTDCALTECMYVANGGVASEPATVTIYAATATGNAAPVRSIGGSKTLLSGASGIAVDAVRNVYVINKTPSVTVYAAGASGNVAPTQTIVGSKTNLNNPHGIAVDGAGKIYIENTADPVSVPASVTVYAAGANGNAKPVQDITGSNTQLRGPTGVAVTSGGTIFVTNLDPGKITVYAAGATGNAKPIRTIAGSKTQLGDPEAIGLDSAGKIYVAQGSGSATSVKVFGSKASGNVKPIESIVGSKTGIDSPSGIATDAAGTMYVVNAFTRCECANNSSLVVFPARSSGNVAPSQALAGSKTLLDVSLGIAVR